MDDINISCVRCGKDNTLDSMVRHSKKGEYHCIDCETSLNNEKYKPLFDDVPKNSKKLSKLMTWFLGCVIIMCTILAGVNGADIYNSSGIMIDGDNLASDSLFKITTHDNMVSIRTIGWRSGTSASYTFSFSILDSGMSELYRQNFAQSGDSNTHKSVLASRINLTPNTVYYIKYNSTPPNYLGAGDNAYFQSVHNLTIEKYGVNLMMAVYNAGTNGNTSYFDFEQFPAPYMPVKIDFFNMTPSNGSNINTPTRVHYNITEGEVPVTCRFYINGTLKDTETYPALGNHTFNFTSSEWKQGYSLLNVTCNNSETIDSDGIKVLFVDTINPVFTQYKWLHSVGMIDINRSEISQGIELEINMSDINMYSFNISICSNTSDGSINLSDCPFKDKSVDIQTASYVYNQTADITLFGTGNRSIYLEACDGHTGTLTEPIDKTVYDGEKITIAGFTIKPLTASVTGITTKDYPDRVSFTSISSKAESLLIFDVTSKDKIYYRSRSGYKAHFVSGKYWLDFENTLYDVEDVHKLSDYHFTVTLRSGISAGEVEFKSVGVINCVNVTLTAFIEQDGNNVTITAPTSSFDTLGLKINVTFNYTPQWVGSTKPDNCTLIINGTKADSDTSIIAGAVNQFIKEFYPPPAQERQYFNASIWCYDLKSVPPLGYYEDIDMSSSINWSIFNTATTTSTTTTAGSGTTTTLPLQITGDERVSYFQTVPEGMFVMFMVLLWLAVTILALTKGGRTGRPIRILYLLGLILGFVSGSLMMYYSFMTGLSIIGTALVVFIGGFF